MNPLGNYSYNFSEFHPVTPPVILPDFPWWIHPGILATFFLWVSSFINYSKIFSKEFSRDSSRNSFVDCSRNCHNKPLYSFQGFLQDFSSRILSSILFKNSKTVSINPHGSWKKISGGTSEVSPGGFLEKYLKEFS